MIRYKRKKTLKKLIFLWVMKSPYHGSQRPEVTKPFSMVKLIEDELVFELTLYGVLFNA